MVGNMSNHIEQERGVMRRLFRKLICRGVDYFTYNGPSCRDYLKSLGISEDRLSHVPYCIDDEIVFTGERSINQDTSQPLRLLYCGAISERKGIVEFSRSLANWCKNNPQRPVNLAIAGSGSLRDKVESISGGSLSIEFLGNCDLVQVRDAYQAADICVFPTLADEWGLVPIEAMASGIPVLGSIYAQSVEACCVEGRNGWIFDPMDERLAGNSLRNGAARPRIGRRHHGLHFGRLFSGSRPQGNSEKHQLRRLSSCPERADGLKSHPPDCHLASRP